MISGLIMGANNSLKWWETAIRWLILRENTVPSLYMVTESDLVRNDDQASAALTGQNQSGQVSNG